MTDNKKIITFLIIAAIIAGGYYFFFSDRNTENGQQTTEQEKVSKSDVIAKELGDRYQATTGWEENLNYTLQAQERLVTGKPTMFRGYIDDIFKQGDKNFIRFSSSFLSPIDYVLELECSQQIVDKIFAQKPDSKDFLKFFDEYVIVANIQEVTKPVFALEGSALSEDEVEINIESSNLFTAKGTCIDVAYIGDDELFND
ncbi:MAG: hypothetical protein ACOXZ1_03625 [Patescibacteria group bacterium]|jgi:hypothetical protein